MKVLIIIPAYNESENIEKVVDNLIVNYPQYDYVVINDCSTDNTLDILNRCSYNYLNLPVNLGIGGCVQTGYLYAEEYGYDITVQLDGDGQHDPYYIKDIIQPILDGQSDMIIGSRFIHKTGFQSSTLRRLGISFLSKLIKLVCGTNISDATSGFRACSKDLTKFYSINYAYDYPEPEAIVSASLNGYRVNEVPVEMLERQGGQSSIHAIRSVYYMIKVTLALFVCKLIYIKRR